MALRRLLAPCVLMLLATPLQASGGDGVEILQFLAGTGADPDGTCRARWRQDAESTDFNVELDHVATGSYELWVAGVQHGSIEVGALGEGEVEFETPKDGDKPLLDFEVLDQLVEIRQGATTFFSDVFDGSGGAGGGGGDGTKTEVFLVNVGPDPDAHGSLRYEAKPGVRRFDVEVEHLDAGTYELRVAGAPVAELVSTGGEELEVEFRDPVEPGKVLLNFDPLGAQVDIASGGVTFLSAVMPASNTETGGKAPSKAGKLAKDLGKGKGDALLVVLLNSGVLPGAHGTATLSQSGESEFEVEIEDVPDGSYGLLVGGASVGTITVASGQGQLEYSTSPGAGQLLLDFEVQGQLVAVTSGADTILSTIFPVSVPAALGLQKKELHVADHVRVNLVNTGADLDARSVLDFRDRSAHDTFTVSLTDLPPGAYDLLVDGQAKAGVLVVAKPDGKAKVVFDTKPKGQKLPLDFPVAGALVQVTPAGDAATVLLQATVD